MRERSRRGLGPTVDHEEQRTQRASFVATYHTRVHTAAASSSQSSCRTRMLGREKDHVNSSARTGSMLEYGAERSAIGASLHGARHSSS